eukprot:TRINITY_DN4306_c0_g1_i1.p1 TRINITY_DN4306_c0_g1~~TRINITY_DN4306_c0_g1_i1.p1  ORF type:complete len:545 (-),score=50.96 TRINITY_DN4306_c0_g1_i1:328-1962(-)
MRTSYRQSPLRASNQSKDIILENIYNSKLFPKKELDSFAHSSKHEKNHYILENRAQSNVRQVYNPQNVHAKDSTVESNRSAKRRAISAGKPLPSRQMSSKPIGVAPINISRYTDSAYLHNNGGSALANVNVNVHQSANLPPSHRNHPINLSTGTHINNNNNNNSEHDDSMISNNGERRVKNSQADLLQRRSSREFRIRSSGNNSRSRLNGDATPTNLNNVSRDKIVAQTRTPSSKSSSSRQAAALISQIAASAISNGVPSIGNAHITNGPYLQGLSGSKQGHYQPVVLNRSSAIGAGAISGHHVRNSSEEHSQYSSNSTSHHHGLALPLPINNTMGTDKIVIVSAMSGETSTTSNASHSTSFKANGNSVFIGSNNINNRAKSPANYYKKILVSAGQANALRSSSRGKGVNTSIQLPKGSVNSALNHQNNNIMNHNVAASYSVNNDVNSSTTNFTREYDSRGVIKESFDLMDMRGGAEELPLETDAEEIHYYFVALQQRSKMLISKMESETKGGGPQRPMCYCQFYFVIYPILRTHKKNFGCEYC